MKNENPLVSVVIPCYNHERFVQDSIQSVIDQTYENIELIIIDDGSKDSSVIKIEEMIECCKKRFTRFEFRSRANIGLSATLNEALEWCQGVYLSCIASDDILKSYKTSVQVDYLQKNILSIGVFGGVELIDENAAVKGTILRRHKKYNFNDIFLHQHNLPAPTQFLRLNNVREVGGYKESLIIEDWPMWLFLTEHGGTLDYISTVFTSYRRHQGNLSARLDDMQKARVEVVELFSSNKLSEKALARTYMVEAHCWQTINSKKSLYYLKKAILLDFSVIFTMSYLKYVIKIARVNNEVN